MLFIFEERVGEGSRKTRKTRKATIELPNMNETLILIHSGSALLDRKPLFVAFGKPNGHLPLFPPFFGGRETFFELKQLESKQHQQRTSLVAPPELVSSTGGLLEKKDGDPG